LIVIFVLLLSLAIDKLSLSSSILPPYRFQQLPAATSTSWLSVNALQLDNTRTRRDVLSQAASAVTATMTVTLVGSATLAAASASDSTVPNETIESTFSSQRQRQHAESTMMVASTSDSIETAMNDKDPPPNLIIDRRSRTSRRDGDVGGNNDDAGIGEDELLEGKDLGSTSSATTSAAVDVISIPRVGYSFYKTPTDQVGLCAALALRAGVRHFDVATQYGTNEEVGKVLQVYIKSGLLDSNKNNNGDGGWLDDRYHIMSMSNEKTESNRRQVLQAYNDADRTTKDRLKRQSQSPSSISMTSRLFWTGIGRQQQQQEEERQRRRGELFISHKLSNEEQSDDPVVIRQCVMNAINDIFLGGRDDIDHQYLDMVSIHSPLTSKVKRLTTYRTLLQMKDDGLIRAVGVCNYGVGPLKEILCANMPLPDVNQLELSPFNTHRDVVDFCNQHGVAVCCSAWSKLSSQEGPTEQWDTLSRLAAAKGMTKAQLLVRWALQKGYLCVPRSAASSKVERLAICENSYGGVARTSFIITEEEMNILDGLNVNYKAGKLKRVDGWDVNDITGPDWDPTEVV
jgi:diketogulonate reductase-like aldo/keto reductase